MLINFLLYHAEYAYTSLGFVESAVFNRALNSVGTEIKVRDSGSVFIRTSLNNPEVDRWRLLIANLLAENSVRKGNLADLIRDRIKAEDSNLEGSFCIRFVKMSLLDIVGRIWMDFL